jgi:large subunit ribosomal protein L4
MVEIPTYRWSEGTVEPVAVDESVFGDKIKWRLLREAVLMYEANKRVGTACTKTRAEIRGTTAKPWRQKGTGRARAGTRKSPIWRGGGVVHGPRPRDYSYSLPRKSLNVALRSAMLGKLRDAEVCGIDAIALDEPKTKRIVEALAALEIAGSTLLVLPEANENAYRSGRNIARCEIRGVTEVNAYDVLRAGTVIVVGDALQRIQERVA